MIFEDDDARPRLERSLMNDPSDEDAVESEIVDPECSAITLSLNTGNLTERDLCLQITVVP